jgi:hypothetical protein
MSKRLRLFTIHLILSLFLASLVISCVYLVWYYPLPLVKAEVITPILLMLISINLIVWPLLSLLVCKEGKKSLKFDFTIIILLQISALCYGVYSIAQGRPVWLVYSVDRFEVVRNNEVIQTHIQQAQPQFQATSWLKPQYAAVQFAKDSKQRNEDMFMEVLEGISIAQRPERYVPLSQVTAQIQQRALSLSLLETFNRKIQVKQLLAKYPNANAYLPLKANAVDMTVLVNKDTAEIIKIVDLRPWK